MLDEGHNKRHMIPGVNKLTDAGKRFQRRKVRVLTKPQYGPGMQVREVECLPSMREAWVLGYDSVVLHQHVSSRGSCQHCKRKKQNTQTEDPRVYFYALYQQRQGDAVFSKILKC